MTNKSVINTIAEDFHRYNCGLNHTDACDWGYSNSYTTRLYRAKARALLGFYDGDVDAARKCIDGWLAMEKTRVPVSR